MELLTPMETAGVLRCSRAKIYALLADNKLPKILVGNSIRVPADELRRWMRANLQRPEKPAAREMVSA